MDKARHVASSTTFRRVGSASRGRKDVVVVLMETSDRDGYRAVVLRSNAA